VPGDLLDVRRCHDSPDAPYGGRGPCRPGRSAVYSA
jgi:hypothetical protein